MFKKISLIFMLLVFLFAPGLVSADTLTCTCDNGNTKKVKNQAECNTFCSPNTGALTIPNPLGTESVETLIGRIIKAILGVVGSLALLMFVYGGLTWMTASGNKEKVEKGKEIIIWATLGLVVIFSSYVLVEFVIDALTTK